MNSHHPASSITIDYHPSSPIITTHFFIKCYFTLGPGGKCEAAQALTMYGLAFAYHTSIRTCDHALARPRKKPKVLGFASNARLNCHAREEPSLHCLDARLVRLRHALPAFVSLAIHRPRMRILPVVRRDGAETAGAKQQTHIAARHEYAHTHTSTRTHYSKKATAESE
jgi:hypothetical protein